MMEGVNVFSQSLQYTTIHSESFRVLVLLKFDILPLARASFSHGAQRLDVCPSTVKMTIFEFL